MIDRARERIEEVRTRVATMREGSSSNPGLLKEIREKGVLSVLEETFPRVKEMRKGGIFASSKSSPESTARGEVGGEIIKEQGITLEIKKGVHGEAI